MKKITALLVSAVLFSAGCGTLDQNIMARKNLSKCKFDFEKIELKDVHLSGSDVKSIDLSAFLRITNKSSGEVALDHVEGDIFLDRHRAATLSHKRLLRIKAGDSVVEEMELNVPFIEAVKALGKKPDNIIIKARLYVNILIGSFTLPTPVVVQVTRTFPVPYDKIEKAIVKGAKDIDGKAVKKKLKKMF